MTLPPKHEASASSSHHHCDPKPVVQIIVCGWTSAPNGHFVSEIWHFSIEEARATVKCLRVSQNVVELKDLDFQWFAVLGPRMFLIGSNINEHKPETVL